MNQSHTPSFHYRKLESDSPRQPWSGDFDFDGSDRRFAFSRQSSFQQSAEPHTPASILTNDSAKALLTRTVSSIDIPPNIYPQDAFGKLQDSDVKFRVSTSASSVFRGVMSGNKQMRRLFMLISLNVAYSTAELCIGLLSGQVGLVSDAFHLTFGCGLLTFSLFAMAASRERPDRVYTYGTSILCCPRFRCPVLCMRGSVKCPIFLEEMGCCLPIRYKRLEVLSAFTNALFLLFLSFSLAVEALHAFIQDESEHKHYLIVSAVTNLLVNLIGVWFFRNYARINLVYRKAEDMNYHAVCLHVLADSIRSAGLILASWLLTLGVKNAEVLCLGLVSAIVFFLVMPLFRATGGILLQMAPPRIPSSALGKCLRQVSSREDVSEVSQARFWELVPGHVIGSILLQVKEGVDDRPILQYVHELYHELGIQDLTVQIDYT